MNKIKLFVVSASAYKGSYFSRTNPIYGHILSYIDYDKCDRVWAANSKFAKRIWKRFGGNV